MSRFRLSMMAASLMFLTSAASAAPLHRPGDPDPQAPSLPSHVSVLQTLESPTDISMGNGPRLLVVFLDRGTPLLRAQEIALLEFSQRHQDIKVVIKELPLVSPESVAIAVAETSVAMAGDPEKWMAFESKVMQAKDLSPAALRRMALASGITAEQYDTPINDGSVAKKLRYNRALAESANIRSAPVFVSDNGQTHSGALSVGGIEALTAAPGHFTN